jgi:hypothetical protein
VTAWGKNKLSAAGKRGYGVTLHENYALRKRLAAAELVVEAARTVYGPFAVEEKLVGRKEAQRAWVALADALEGYAKGVLL